MWIVMGQEMDKTLVDTYSSALAGARRAVNIAREAVRQMQLSPISATGIS
jgi:hypothetical protein